MTNEVEASLVELKPGLIGLKPGGRELRIKKIKKGNNIPIYRREAEVGGKGSN